MKEEYVKPTIEVVEVETSELLAGSIASGNTETLKPGQSYFDDDESNEESAQDYDILPTKY